MSRDHEHEHGTLDCAACLWGELQAGRMIEAPRLETRFGACPSCLLGASDAANIGGLTWAYCRDCLVRWVVDGPFSMLAPSSDAFEELFCEALDMCDELDPSPDATSATPRTINHEETMTLAKRQSSPTTLDIRKFQPPRENLILAGMYPARRIAITELVIQHVAHACEPHPVNGRPVLNEHRLWQAIRYLPVDDNETTVETALRESDVTTPVPELGRVAAMLLSLRERRAFLSQQIEMLDELEAAFAEEVGT